jgi:hypothetical protein
MVKTLDLDPVKISAPPLTIPTPPLSSSAPATSTLTSLAPTPILRRGDAHCWAVAASVLARAPSPRATGQLYFCPRRLGRRAARPPHRKKNATKGALVVASRARSRWWTVATAVGGGQWRRQRMDYGGRRATCSRYDLIPICQDPRRVQSLRAYPLVLMEDGVRMTPSCAAEAAVARLRGPAFSSPSPHRASPVWCWLLSPYVPASRSWSWPACLG